MHRHTDIDKGGQSYKKINQKEEVDWYGTESDSSSYFDWKWFHNETGFYFTWLFALTLLAITAAILAGVLWDMRGGSFECIANPLLTGQVQVEGENLGVYGIVDLAATGMEFESALIGTRLEKCVDFCKKSFNIGEYACDNDFCNVCHVAAFDMYSYATPYALCIKSCDCCMENKCSGSCESFVSENACGFHCQNFGYPGPTSCVQ